MPVPPQAAWEATYEPETKAYYAAYQLDQSYKVANLWQKWIDPNVIGIEAAPPYAPSVATTDATAFSPVNLEGASSVAQIAQILATAWKNYVLAFVWPPPPPVPPFSAITLVETSPTGAAAAYAILMTGLIAELVLVPGNPATAFADKATAYSALFRTATLSIGIQITGLGIGAPPPPLVLPLSGVQ